MSKALRGLLILNAVVLIGIIVATTGNAQLPPMTNREGIPFFNVNINPTDVPPLVNINPNGMVPNVEIVRMPEIPRLDMTKMPDLNVRMAGCANRQNFQTDIGRSIEGPLVITYLDLSQPVQATLSSPQNGSKRVTLGNASQLSTAIYLRTGQRLEFGADVMYSGCVPE